MARRKRQIRRLNKRIGRLQNKMQGGLFGQPSPPPGPPQGMFGPPQFPQDLGMAGGNMFPGGMAGGNMLYSMPQAGGPQGMAGGNMLPGMQDYVSFGGQAFPGMDQWQPNAFQPQMPVDLSPWESGGGGGGGPSYLYDRDLGGRRPKNWDKGGYGGPTPFGSWNKKQRRKFKRRFNEDARRMGGPNFRQAQKEAWRNFGGRGSFKNWKRQQRQANQMPQGGGFDVSNPVMANMVMQSAGQMWPGLGNIMQSIPGAGGTFMERMGFPGGNYPAFYRGYFGGGRDAGSPG